MSHKGVGDGNGMAGRKGEGGERKKCNPFGKGKDTIWKRK